MKTKLYIVSGIIFAALGLSFLASTTANAAPICGDTDFTGACPAPVPACDDKNYAAQSNCIPPVNYATVNCATAFRNSYEGPGRCAAIKACLARNVAQVDCMTQWRSCRDAVTNPQGAMKSVDREGCVKAVETGVAYTPAGATDENKTSCTVEGIGWILCPVMRFLSQLVDQAYGIVGTMLSVPAVDTSATSPMYQAWSVMRNFANVAFVMTFLLIIYSQITGVGLSNLGIKKMLPKLILAAVLVNVSYWICAVAVDISNIAGASMKGLLEGTANQLYVPGGSTSETGAGGNWDVLTVGLLGAAGVGVALYVGLSALLPMLISAAFAIVMVVLILTLRQALIIILIVVSPLAFVAYLLPNTESLFNKWKGGFQTLLLIYPIMGVIFGGSAIAATIITNTAKGNFILETMGAGMTILPFFGLLALRSLTEKGLGRFGIKLNDPTKGPVDRLKRGAEGYRGNRQQLRDARALNGQARVGGFMVRRKARREAVLSQRGRNYNNAKTGYVAEASLSDQVSTGQKALSWATAGDIGGKTNGERLLDQMAKGGGPGAKSAALAQALTVQAKIEAEEVQAASATIKALNLTQDERRTLSGGGEVTKGGRVLKGGEDMALQRAAIQSVVDTADVKGINDLVDQSLSWNSNTGDKAVDQKNEQLRKSLADSLGSSSSRPGYLGQGDLEAIRQDDSTRANSYGLIEKAIANNVYSAEKIATADKDEINVVATVNNTSTTLTTPQKQQLVNNAHSALTDPILSKKVGKNLENITHTRNNTTPTPLS